MKKYCFRSWLFMRPWLFICTFVSQALASDSDTLFVSGSTARQVYDQLWLHAAIIAEHCQGSGLQVNLVNRAMWNNMPDCSESAKVVFSGPNTQGKLSVNVVCYGEPFWKRRYQAQVSFTFRAVAAARDIARGEKMHFENLELTDVSLSSLRSGYFKAIESLDEYYSVRLVKAGTIITTAMIKKRVLIKKGSPVNILLSSGTVQVKARGIALQAGSRGDIVEVEKENGRIIRCYVKSDQEVTPVVFQDTDKRQLNEVP